MVYGRARVHGDEDGVDQVGKDDDESSKRLVRRAGANDSKALRLGGRSNTRRNRRFDHIYFGSWQISFGKKKNKNLLVNALTPELPMNKCV